MTGTGETGPSRDAGALTDEQRQLAVSFMTTEHFTLQTARSITTAEASGRSALYLSTLSSALVALGFVAQASDFGQPFAVFALTVLPPIVFLGFITFQRAVQSGIADLFYEQGLARVRSFYVTLLPEMRPWFLEPTDEAAWSPGALAASVGRWQLALTVASAIAVTNSVVAGAVCAILADLLAGPPLPVTVAVGVVAGVLAVVGHHRYQAWAWRRVDDHIHDRAPAVRPDADAPATSDENR